MIDVIIPTFGRPARLPGLVRNITANTISPHRIVLAVEAHDQATLDAIPDGCQVVINEGSRNYSGALNTAWRQSDAEWMFAGADDLVFHPRWDHHCLRAADGWFTVVGTNDLLNTMVATGMHSTHTLVHRDYLTEFGGVVDEGPGSFYPECYDHNFCDTEFIATAKMRCRFRPCLDAVVEHLHVTTGKVEADDTHWRSIRHYDDDSRMFDMRRHLWAGLVR